MNISTSNPLKTEIKLQMLKEKNLKTDENPYLTAGYKTLQNRPELFLKGHSGDQFLKLLLTK